MEDTIKNIYCHFCNIEKIDDKTIQVSLNQQSLCMDGSVPLVKITLQDDGKYFISDNAANFFDLYDDGFDYDKFEKIVKKLIKVSNKENANAFNIKLSKGCIYAENVDAFYLNIIIENIVDISCKTYNKYKKLTF